MYNAGFDNGGYLEMQSARIRQRISEFGGKLYLEFGGKLFDDYHASRVLPGFLPDSKLQLLLQLKDDAEIVIVVNAEDIEKCKVRSDLGITYEVDALRLVEAFGACGLKVGSIVLTKYAPLPRVLRFEKKLKNEGIPFYRHYVIEGYPSDVANIVSDSGFGRNEYIETERKLVVVTAPGPGSGKMATCLSQLYHDNQRGIKAGYAKFETFPIWNLPLRHPVNMAYEAATADLNDINMIDPWHLEAYGKTAVNYNRDVEIFPVLKAIFENIYGKCPYKSPTDMGVNMAGFCIFDDGAVCEAARQEIIRRYFGAVRSAAKGAENREEIYKLELLMNQAEITADSRKCTAAARRITEQTGAPGAAAELADGTVITGKTSDLLGCVSAALINCLKHLAGIEKDVLLIDPAVIKPIQELKVNYLGSKNPRLHSDEVLTALSISAGRDKNAAAAMAQLAKLKNCDIHATALLSYVDENVLKKLGMRLTCEPENK